MKVCAEPGCPALQRETRCLDHRRDQQRAAGTRTQRGYGSDYLRQLRAPEYVNATTCAACGQPFTEQNPKTGGHSVPIRRGGKGSPILPHCAACNYGWRRTDL